MQSIPCIHSLSTVKKKTKHHTKNQNRTTKLKTHTPHPPKNLTGLASKIGGLVHSLQANGINLTAFLKYYFLKLKTIYTLHRKDWFSKYANLSRMRLVFLFALLIWLWISMHSRILKNYILPSSVNLPLADFFFTDSSFTDQYHFREDIFIMVTDF